MRHHFTCDGIHFYGGQYSKMMNLIRLRHRLVIGGLGGGGGGGGGVKGKTDAQFCIHEMYHTVFTHF